MERRDREPVGSDPRVRAGGTGRAGRRGCPSPSGSMRHSSHASPGSFISAWSRTASVRLERFDPPEVHRVADVHHGRVAPAPPHAHATDELVHEPADGPEPVAPVPAAPRRRSRSAPRRPTAGGASTWRSRRSASTVPPDQSGSVGIGSAGRRPPSSAEDQVVSTVPARSRPSAAATASPVGQRSAGHQPW